MAPRTVPRESQKHGAKHKTSHKAYLSKAVVTRGLLDVRIVKLYKRTGSTRRILSCGCTVRCKPYCESLHGELGRRPTNSVELRSAVRLFLPFHQKSGQALQSVGTRPKGFELQTSSIHQTIGPVV